MSLESIPTWFSDTAGITLAAAQVILSVSVLLAVLLPIMLLSRNRSGFVIEIIVIFVMESLLVGIGWLPFWILILTIGAIAIAIAVSSTQAVVGR